MAVTTYQWPYEISAEQWGTWQRHPSYFVSKRQPAQGKWWQNKILLKPHRVPNLNSYHVEEILIVNPFQAFFGFDHAARAPSKVFAAYTP